VNAARTGLPSGPTLAATDHSVRFHPAQLTRREVHHHHNFAADQRLRFVILRDARANLAHFAADVDCQLQQFVCADDALGRLDLAHAHLHFREIFNRDLLRPQSAPRLPKRLLAHSRSRLVV